MHILKGILEPQKPLALAKTSKPYTQQVINKKQQMDSNKKVTKPSFPDSSNTITQSTTIDIPQENPPKLYTPKIIHDNDSITSTRSEKIPEKKKMVYGRYGSIITHLSIDEPTTEGEKIAYSISKTQILWPYTKDIKSCEEIYSSSPSRKIIKKVYKLTLQNYKKLVLKTELYPKEFQGKVMNRWREYYIGRILGHLTKFAVKSLDLKKEIIEDNQNILIELLTEYGGESLNSLENVDNTVYAKIVYQLVNALLVLEECGISHFDIKPENIVWDEESSLLKLIDFGTSIQFCRNPEKIARPLSGDYDRVSGFTQCYVPFEIYKKKVKSDFASVIPQKVDAFGCGMTLLEVLLENEGHRNVLKECESEVEYEEYLKILKEKLSHSPWKKVLEPCLKENYKEAPTFAQLKGIVIKTLQNINLHNSEILPRQDENGWFYINDIFKLNPEEHDAKYFGLRTYLNQLANQGFKSTVKIAIANTYLGEECIHLCKFSEALECFKEAQQIYRDTIGKTAIEVATLENKIGRVYSCSFQHKTALTHFNNAKRIFTDNALLSGVIQTYLNIGNAYSNLFENEKALEQYKKTKRIIIKNCTLPNEILAKIYMNIGSVYNNMLQYVDAITYFHRAEQYMLSIENSILGPKMAPIYFTIATTENAFISNEIAINYLHKARIILTNLYGEEHPEVAKVLIKRARLVHKMGLHQYEVGYLQIAESSLFKFYGEDHPLIGYLYNELGDAFKCTKGRKVALSYYKKAEKILKNAYSPKGHIDIVITQINIGETCIYFKEYDAAIKYLTDAEKGLLAITKSKNNPYCGKIYGNLGAVYKIMCKGEQAVEYYKQSKDCFVNFYGENHADVAKAYHSLGSAQYLFDDLKGAIENCLKAEQIMKKVHGSASNALDSIYNTLTNIYMLTRNVKKADEYIDKSQYLSNDSIQRDHPDYLKCVNLLRNAYKFEQGILLSRLG
eukprot:TRINITY_DN135810_c0_g1_i1.p1 TRINITY_DN135810_c0_g1~~TRINITY_DN135810_c0_g1_i1.p1  ORF type:complete len:1001 (+),score=88.47 TRINITY_DN135810_c0_g1_i1:128-3004(+)